MFRFFPLQWPSKKLGEWRLFQSFLPSMAKTWRVNPIFSISSSSFLPSFFPTSKMAQLQSYTAGLAIAVGFFGHGGSNNVPWRCRPGGWTWEISQKKSRCISLGKRGKIMGKWWENMIGNWVQWWTIHGDSSQTCKVSNKPVNILRSQMLINPALQPNSIPESSTYVFFQTLCQSPVFSVPRKLFRTYSQIQDLAILGYQW